MSKSKHPQQSEQGAHTQPTEIEKREIIREVLGIVRHEFSGPLPAPEMLEHYDKVITNGAERIMSMAEEQGKHRRELEKNVIERDSRNSTLGVVFAFILGLSTIVAGTCVAISGHSWPGALLGSAGLVGLTTVFIYGTNQRRREREAKAKSNS